MSTSTRPATTDATLRRTPDAFWDRVLVAAPVVAGVLLVVAVLADPAAGKDGLALYRAEAAHPGQLQTHTILLHWAFAFWTLTGLLLARTVVGKGGGLAKVAAALGFVGMCSLPGFVIVDLYDSAFAHAVGASTVVSVHDRMDATMWGQGVLYVPGAIGFFLVLPLVGLALWRAGRMPWWPAALVLVGEIVLQASGAVLWAAVVAALTLVVFAGALRGSGVRRRGVAAA